jgi:hypothetical protein
MSVNKTLSTFFASAILTLYILPVHADSITKLEKDQYSDSAAPDVDPNASKGADKSIVTQERDQYGNSASPDVDPNASKGPDKSIVDQERAQIPH